MSATRFLYWAVVCTVSFFFSGGCGESFKLAEVSGTVTVDGVPAANLQVLFEPQDKNQPSSIGFTNADGKYQLRCSSGVDGAAVGRHTVRVEPVETDDPEGSPLAIPAKYNTSSQLTEEVKAGTNTIDLKLSRR